MSTIVLRGVTPGPNAEETALMTRSPLRLGVALREVLGCSDTLPHAEGAEAQRASRFRKDRRLGGAPREIVREVLREACGDG